MSSVKFIPPNRRIERQSEKSNMSSHLELPPKKRIRMDHNSNVDKADPLNLTVTSNSPPMELDYCSDVEDDDKGNCEVAEEESCSQSEKEFAEDDTSSTADNASDKQSLENCELAEKESCDQCEKSAGGDMSSTADNAPDKQSLEDSSDSGELIIVMEFSSSSSTRSSTSSSSTDDDDSTKAISKKFKPPKVQNKPPAARKYELKKSKNGKNLSVKEITATLGTSKNKMLKKIIKKKPKNSQQISQVMKNLPKNGFTSVDSSSEMLIDLLKLNKGVVSSCGTEDSLLTEQSVSLLKDVTSTIDVYCDDSSREVTSSADFTQNNHMFPVLCENESNLPVSPAMDSSPQSIHAKKFSFQSSPAKKSSFRSTSAKKPSSRSLPPKKSSPRPSPEKKSKVLKPTRSLTDAEYEEIFSSVINASVSTNVEGETQAVDKSKTNVMNVSEETSLTKQSDMEVKTPEKGLKLNTSTPKSSQKNKVTCSPWGHHYSKQSQDSLHNEFHGASDPENLKEDSQVTNFSQATNASLNSTSNSRCHTSVECSPWGHHYSKIRKNSQSSETKERTRKVAKTNKQHKTSQKFRHESEDIFESENSSDSKVVSTVGVSEGSTAACVSPRKMVFQLSQSSPVHLSEDTIVTQRERLEWLQKQRNVGIWVQCTNKLCKAFRFLPDIHDPLEVPDIWYCQHHPDVQYQTCGKNINTYEVKDDEWMVENDYNAGSVVWAKVDGFPWWPAMIDVDPDTENFFWLKKGTKKPTYYNAVFFDSKAVTRSWVATRYIHRYENYENCSKFSMCVKNKQYLRERILEAKRQAADALTMPLIERLAKYSFVARYTGPINDPLTKEEEDKMMLNKRNKKKAKKLCLGG